MKSFARLALFFLIALTALTVRAAPQVLDRIIAVVNDGVILQSELDRAMLLAENQLHDRGIAAPPEELLRAQVLERLILTKLQTQKAAQDGIKVDDQELNDVLENIARQNKMTLPQFVEQLKKEGIDYPTLREQVRDEVLAQRVRQKEVGSRVVVTDQDVDLAMANSTEADNTEYHLAHILIAVPDGATATVRDKARAKALKVLKAIQGGEDFAKLAVENSDGQQALQGGDLGWRKGADLPTLFASVVPHLAVGQVSDLLEGGNGYNVIKLLDKRDNGERTTVTETHAEHILLKPNAIRDEAATEALIHDLYRRVTKGENFETLATKYSDDPGSKNAGGDLGWQPPGVFATDFQNVLDALKPGELSQPFHTEFGWHIARVLERRTRDATEETRRARIRQAIGSRKEAEDYETWLRRLREDAYVEYRLGPIGNDTAAPSSTGTPKLTVPHLPAG